MIIVSKDRILIYRDVQYKLGGLAFATVDKSLRRKASVFGTCAMEQSMLLKERAEIIEKEE